ncbi:hypothetical protein [Agromyces sp. Marseille-Q5079]|uniref:hypothetical protein n=1 Tax=Agromyces sp. Marseille-Q5079 TaxID=3439059 RepID=UPI003D9CB584
MNDSHDAGRTSTMGSEPASFDVRGFARTAHGSLRDDLDLDAIADAGLPHEAVRAVTTLAALEGATMAHLRNVLVTPTHKDARVTAFLVSWAYEKYWIADALRQVTDAAGTAEPVRPGADTAMHGRETGRGPIRRAIAGFGQGPDVIGAHLALGRVDDLMLGLAYDRLGAIADEVPNRALADAVARILAIKARHAAFFETEAARRLAASPRAARLARRELRRSAWPLGSGAIPVADRRSFARFALEGDGATRLARGIRSLPGIDERTASRVVGRFAG